VSSGFADRGLTTWLPRRYPRPRSDEQAFASHPLVSPVRQLLAAFPICPNLSAYLELHIAPNNEKTEHQYYPDGRKVNGKPMALLLGVGDLGNECNSPRRILGICSASSPNPPRRRPSSLDDDERTRKNEGKVKGRDSQIHS
jgi:hypothetical protein